MGQSFGELLGRDIREERERRGMTQIKLALNSGCDERRIRDYESGNVGRPQAKVYRPICDVLGITPDRIRQLKEQATDPDVRHLVNAAGAEAAANHLSQSLLIALAFEYAPDQAGDMQSAYAGLRKALQEAAAQKARGALPSNVDDAVSQVMARVEALNDQGDVDGAALVLDAEIARAEEETRRQTARLAALHDAAITQSRLTNAPKAAARHLLARLTLEAPRDAFTALRILFMEWYERGRDRGLAFDLQVSIALAETNVERAASPDQRGAALIDLGSALQTLGERESGTARLNKAMQAFAEALKEYTRDRAPMQWAGAQNNLGAALSILGVREPGTARLEQAVAAHKSVLEVWTRDRVPLDWAMTQNNLGNALQTLGAREPGTARLDAAVAHFHAALEERTRNRVPLDWAATQNNLGNALRTLGVRERGTARLEAAVRAYLSALEVWTRDRVPLDWALTQNNLGAALSVLGEREPGTARLEAAVTAFGAALEVRTRDQIPLGWAASFGNQGMALWRLADRTDDVALARRALQQLTEAEAQMRAGGHIPAAEIYATRMLDAQALVDRLTS